MNRIISLVAACFATALLTVASSTPAAVSLAHLAA